MDSFFTGAFTNDDIDVSEGWEQTRFGLSSFGGLGSHGFHGRLGTAPSLCAP